MPRKPYDYQSMVGQTFGRLTVMGTQKKGGERLIFICVCKCGNEHSAVALLVVRSHIMSCGCLHKETVGNRARTHGSSGKGTYGSWQNMKARCNNESNPAYRNYGGRGIKVCDSWMESFEQFVLDTGERPPGTSLDRINNDGNYEPGNVRWANRVEQANNRRIRPPRFVGKVMYNGEMMHANVACSLLGISYPRVYGLHKKGRKHDLQRAFDMVRNAHGDLRVKGQRRDPETCMT